MVTPDFSESTRSLGRHEVYKPPKFGGLDPNYIDDYKHYSSNSTCKQQCKLKFKVPNTHLIKYASAQSMIVVAVPFLMRENIHV